LTVGRDPTYTTLWPRCRLIKEFLVFYFYD